MANRTARLSSTRSPAQAGSGPQGGAFRPTAGAIPPKMVGSENLPYLLYPVACKRRE